jgi:hypothetical protein
VKRLREWAGGAPERSGPGVTAVPEARQTAIVPPRRSRRLYRRIGMRSVASALVGLLVLGVAAAQLTGHDGGDDSGTARPDGVPILGPAGTVAVFDARLWHRRRDNLGTRIRRAMFMAYSYRWLTSRDTPIEDVPEWAGLPRIRRQLLGDKTVDPFYWAAGELPLDPRSTGFQEAA